jgi:hypothetical protein
MAYNPVPFTTDDGLNSSVIRGWAYDNDLATAARWLASGNKHPRLATELVYEAVKAGHLDLAEQVWQAGWHKMPSTLEHAWGRLETHPERTTMAPQDAASVEWLLSKSEPLPGTRRSAAQNAGLMAGLQYAFRSNNPALWERILAEGANCQCPAGYDVFIDLSLFCSWLKTDTQVSSNAPAWAEEHALEDLLDHGLAIGGEVWIQTMRQPETARLFEALMERAETLTSPRQRSAIMAAAQGYELIEERKQRMEALFFRLGVVETIALTAREQKTIRGDFDILDTLFVTPNRPHIHLPRPTNKTLVLTNGAMDLLEAFPESSRAERRAQMIHAQLRPSPLARKPQPRF